MITNKDLNNEYSLFARNIKYNRERLNMTQEELAEKSDISVSYIKQIERGKDYKNISLTIMLKLSKALNTSIRDLFNEKSFWKAFFYSSTLW